MPKSSVSPIFARAALAATLCLAPALASAATVFEADPRAPGGFDITPNPGSSFPPPSEIYTNVGFTGPFMVFSGPESFSGMLASGARMTTLEFEIFEPSTTGPNAGCNATCIDSKFNLSLFDGITEVFTADFFPTDDTVQLVSFAGIPGLTFDMFEITEVIGGVDNEYFANFEATLAPIPLPASGLLLLVGAGALVAIRRRGSAA